MLKSIQHEEVTLIYLVNTKKSIIFFSNLSLSNMLEQVYKKVSIIVEVCR